MNRPRLGRRSLRGLALFTGGIVTGAVVAMLAAKPVTSLWSRVESKAARKWADWFGGDVPPEAEWVTRAHELLPHATGFDYPVRIALHPEPPTQASDPFYFVAELPGHIRLVTLDGTIHTVAEDLLNFEWKPPQELGLMGLEIDPSGDRLYAAMTYWDEADGVWKNKLEALELERTPGKPPTVKERKVLLDIASEPTVASYCIQFVSVGPDDRLYVGIGAGGNKTDAQVLDKFAGKIIRLEKDGTAPRDNPFFDASAPDSAKSYVFAYGLRNPWDITWDPDTKVGLVSEVGPGVDRIIRLDRGVNYVFGEGGPQKGDSRMRANALYSWGPGGHFAPTGITLADGSMFGAEEGRFIYLGLFGPVHMPGANDGKQLLRFGFSPTGHLNTGPEVVARYNGQHFSSITDVVAAHDAIYFADLYGPGDGQHRGQGIIYRVEQTEALGQGQVELAADVQGTERGEQLFTLAGCQACHDLGSESTGKEGPPLGGLADRLSTRLSSSDYESALRELASRSGSYFERNRERYQALLDAEGDMRPRLWFRYHIADPRFDHPESKMPAFPQLTEKDVDALADFLLDG